MDWDPFLRVLWAALLALPVGLEREVRGKAAGLRTHVMVAAASAALGSVSVLAAEPSEMADRTRIAAQVVSGIGFMGAGVIFASGGRVHGLTTAAALWSASAIGLVVGLGGLSLGIALTVVVVLLLGPVNWLSEHLVGPLASHERSVQLIVDDLDMIDRTNGVLRRHGVSVREVALEEVADTFFLHLVVRCRDRVAQQLLADLEAIGPRYVHDSRSAGLGGRD